MKTKRISAFEEGIVWNYVAVLLMALNGFVCNFIIALFYDATAVGLYNRIYSYYLVLSQLSVFGIHMSIMQSIPKLVNDKEKQKISLSSAIAIAFLVACITAVGIKVFLICSTDWLDIITKHSVENIIVALILFSINKVVLAYYNGMSMMKEHAILQSVRYIMLGGSVFFLAFIHVNVENLVLCFLISEISVLVLEILMYIFGKMPLGKIEWQYAKIHFNFGKKIFLSNIVLDLNTKVDIISLGIFLKDDYYIGIYSFAIMFIEGFYQMLVVIRKSLNPKITQFYYDIEKSVDTFKKAEKMTHILSGILYIGIIVGYPIICLIMGEKDYYQGILVILVIGFTIMLTNKYILYGNVFSQIGEPKKETEVNIYTVIVNILANTLFIPVFGINGAAIATGISYVVFAIIIKKYVREQPKLCILFNK